MDIKKISVIFKGLAALAFLLGMVGLSSSSDAKQTPGKLAHDACVAGPGAEDISSVRQDEEAEFFIVGCGGFL